MLTGEPHPQNGEETAKGINASRLAVPPGHATRGTVKATSTEAPDVVDLIRYQHEKFSTNQRQPDARCIPASTQRKREVEDEKKSKEREKERMLVSQKKWE